MRPIVAIIDSPAGCFSSKGVLSTVVLWASTCEGGRDAVQWGMLLGWADGETAWC